ncbi:hypothetical protein SLA2020_298280 [Shorea laevis]
MVLAAMYASHQRISPSKLLRPFSILPTPPHPQNPLLLHSEKNQAPSATTRNAPLTAASITPTLLLLLHTGGKTFCRLRGTWWKQRKGRCRQGCVGGIRKEGMH